MHRQQSFQRPFSRWFLCHLIFRFYLQNFLKASFNNVSSRDADSPILASIACIISFNCFVEKPAESVDLSRFHLGMSEIISSVFPKIGPPPMLPPPGVRCGNALKLETKISWIRFGSTLKMITNSSDIVQLAQWLGPSPRTRSRTDYFWSFPVRIVGVVPL